MICVSTFTFLIGSLKLVSLTFILMLGQAGAQRVGTAGRGRGQGPGARGPPPPPRDNVAPAPRTPHRKAGVCLFSMFLCVETRISMLFSLLCNL